MLDKYVMPGDVEFAVNLDSMALSPKSEPIPLFSYTKDATHSDILYPHWSFFKGGECFETAEGEECITKYVVDIYHISPFDWIRCQISCLEQ